MLTIVLLCAEINGLNDLPHFSRSMPSAFDDGTNSGGIFDVGTSIRKNKNPILEIKRHQRWDPLNSYVVSSIDI